MKNSHISYVVISKSTCRVAQIETLKNVFYMHGQEPPSGESTTTECWVNYQLLAVIYGSSPMGNS